jgi:cereblon
LDARSRSSAPAKGRAKRRLPADEESAGRSKRILCRWCGEALSDVSAIFATSASGTAQTFLNPYGFLHEVVTVRWARSLTLSGPPTTEFTWYPGYAWEVASCGRCRAHVGWAFRAVSNEEPERFWALRRDGITEEPS